MRMNSYVVCEHISQILPLPHILHWAVWGSFVMPGTESPCFLTPGIFKVVHGFREHLSFTKIDCFLHALSAVKPCTKKQWPCSNELGCLLHCYSVESAFYFDECFTGLRGICFPETCTLCIFVCAALKCEKELFSGRHGPNFRTISHHWGLSEHTVLSRMWMPLGKAAFQAVAFSVYRIFLWCRWWGILKPTLSLHLLAYTTEQKQETIPAFSHAELSYKKEFREHINL